MEPRATSRTRRWLRGMCISLPGVLILGNVGCKCCGLGLSERIDNCAVVEKGSYPEPNGFFVKEYVHRQTTKAEADDFVIYQHEWYMDGKTLGPWGGRHLDIIIRRLATVPFAVLIEASDDPQLNKARWDFIVSALSQAGVPAPEMRVFLGRPQAEGLYGDEAPRIFYQLISPQQFGQGSSFGGYQNFGGLGGGGIGGGFGGFR